MVMPSAHRAGRCIRSSQNKGSVRTQRYRQPPGDHASPLGAAVLSRTGTFVNLASTRCAKTVKAQSRHSIFLSCFVIMQLSSAASDFSESRSWLYQEYNKHTKQYSQKGPVDEGKFPELLAQGMITNETWVWTKGQDEWKQIANVVSLAKNLNFQEVWWYGHDTVQKGPVSLKALLGFLSNRRINEKTLVWTQGFEGWKLVKDVPELLQSLPLKDSDQHGKKQNSIRIQSSQIFVNKSTTSPVAKPSPVEESQKPEEMWSWKLAGEWQDQVTEKVLVGMIKSEMIDRETKVYSSLQPEHLPLKAIPRFTEVLLQAQQGTFRKRRRKPRRAKPLKKQKPGKFFVDHQITAFALRDPRKGDPIYLNHNGKDIECKIRSFGSGDTWNCNNNYGILEFGPEARKVFKAITDEWRPAIRFAWYNEHKGDFTVTLLEFTNGN